MSVRKSLKSQMAPSVTGGIANILALLGKQTPFVHAGVRVKGASSGAKGALTLVLLVVIAAIIVGIILCNKYGLKGVDRPLHVHDHQKELQKRFSYGIGTGILAVSATGSLGLGVIGLIILFVLGRDKALTVSDGGLSHEHLIRRRYYMGVAAGGLLGLLVNKVGVSLLRMD